MLVAEEAVEIRVLSRQGKSIREIARMLEISRNTVRRYVRSEVCRGTSVRSGPASSMITSSTSLNGYLPMSREQASLFFQTVAPRGDLGGEERPAF
jgi:Homeodomain-like domain